MMTFPLTDCCTMLGVDPKTLRTWLKRSQMQLVAHPTDARLKCLTEEQVQQLASLHDRPLPSLTSEQGKEHPHPPCDSPLLEAVKTKPTLGLTEMDLIEKLGSLETKVTTLQEQLAQLTLELLHERQMRAEQRLGTLEALLPQMLALGSSSPAVLQANNASPAAAPSGPQRHLQPAEVRARSRVLPLIEYGAEGSYVVVCPQQGVLPLTPDSPEWFDWLASLTSFRFLGQLGRFSACRNSDGGQRTRSWLANRSFHGRLYRHHLGVTDRLTVAYLEQTAVQLQSRLTAL